MLVSCTWQGGLRTGETAVYGNPAAPASAEACAASLHTQTSDSALPLADNKIRLFSWNMHKNTDSDMQADMARLGNDAHLILLQEATARTPSSTSLHPDYHWAFAPGYASSDKLSGVMTASKVAPILQCSLKNIEPWLGSPKATNITQYALADRDDTLLVVNIHLINFTMGLTDMQRQLDEALSVLAQHQGPAIVSGDFNTWSLARNKAVNDAMSRAGLTPVEYHTDLRTRVFGNTLDHVYVRGMRVAAGTSHEVSSSDHNPISVVLELVDEMFAGLKDDANKG